MLSSKAQNHRDSNRTKPTSTENQKCCRGDNMDLQNSKSRRAPTLAMFSSGSPGRRLQPIRTTTNIYDLQSSDLNLLSPPITPVKRAATNMSQPASKTHLLPTPRASLEERLPLTWGNVVTKKFTGKYKLGRQIGEGAWSDVGLAQEVCEIPQDPSRLTPPSSPDTTSQNSGKLLAVKIPNQKAARRVLDREARMLTYLSSDPAGASYLVDFHGQDQFNGALVLEYASLTLKRHVSERSSALQLSTSTMYDPVIGETPWKYFARHLISALAWLHSRDVAHGDIKPDNILMRRTVTEPSLDSPLGGMTFTSYQPILIDFSSSLLTASATSANAISPEDLAQQTADDAITTTYASPELLESFRFVTKTFAKEVDRQKADVWAMAVTLAYAATGTEPYSEARMPIQRTMMAKHGDILGSLRGSSQATRIMKGGFVAKTVAKGVALDPAVRASAAAWVEVLDFGYEGEAKEK